MVDTAFAKNLNFSANNKNVNVNLKSRLFLKYNKLYLDNVLPKNQLINSIKYTLNYIVNFD